MSVAPLQDLAKRADQEIRHELVEYIEMQDMILRDWTDVNSLAIFASVKLLLNTMAI